MMMMEDDDGGWHQCFAQDHKVFLFITPSTGDCLWLIIDTRDSKFHLLQVNVLKVIVAALLLNGAGLENHFKQVKLKLL
jgi:hypothetical protein